MLGAPVLSGTAGSLISVLDLLVTGMGLKSADSVVVANGVATMTFSSGHSFEAHAVAQVTGTSPAALNGEKRILVTTLNTATFAAPGVPDGAATGSITAKLAGAGWEKAFAGTNLAAYRSADVTSTRMFLRVDDTGTINARLVGYESMSDVNTGLGPFPTAAQIGGGGYWPKANAASATARSWTLIADSKSFILSIGTSTVPGASGAVWSFGDFAADRSGDAYACLLQCAVFDSATQQSLLDSAHDYVSGVNSKGSYVPRSFTAVGSSIACATGLESYVGSSYGASGSFDTPLAPRYPNPANNGLILTRKIIAESGVTRRGALRGLHFPVSNCHAAFAWRDLLDGQGVLAGRKLMAIKCGSPAGTTSQGVLFTDITGPWDV